MVQNLQSNPLDKSVEKPLLTAQEIIDRAGDLSLEIIDPEDLLKRIITRALSRNNMTHEDVIKCVTCIQKIHADMGASFEADDLVSFREEILKHTESDIDLEQLNMILLESLIMRSIDQSVLSIISPDLKEEKKEPTPGWFSFSDE